VHVVLARRPGPRRDRTDDRPLVVLARTGPGGWTAARRLPTAAALDSLDWVVLAAASRAPTGWSDAGRLWAVCTHGTRDACCARWGRPLAAALAAATEDPVWEISHTGGHRFAGVLLALPEGVVYGRVTPGHVPQLLTARADRRLVPELHRGRTHLPPWHQAAEAALRRHLTEDRLDALVPLGAEPGPDGGRRTHWHHLSDDAGSRWQVDVVQVPVPARAVSCGGEPEPGTSWQAGTPRPVPA
jgi:hypothetical protein